MNNNIPNPFILDTNAYFLFFQHPKKPHYYKLINKVSENPVISFYISEITSMEIQSVIGKYRRGSTTQVQKCDRNITIDDEIKNCQNSWIIRGRRKMRRKVYRGIQKMLKDIERQRGTIQATILKLSPDTIIKARKILMDYADTFNIGSHDAVIIATLIKTVEEQNIPLTLVTSDKGMKAVLSAKLIPFFDPQE
ncbi:MAG: DUF4935 domain-containing protein [Desulfobacterales bacterium]|uniref:DUF4935 domain-containing protein n=1 Tax=Candidatus Desulfatibia vada TaxID=2841696 RepID=A0A8J6P3E5_9BACT|nr:DUF4935 domain-containing protein [Candidatus Desulfatibia vada]